MSASDYNAELLPPPENQRYANIRRNLFFDDNVHMIETDEEKAVCSDLETEQMIQQGQIQLLKKVLSNIKDGENERRLLRDENYKLKLKLKSSEDKITELEERLRKADFKYRHFDSHQESRDDEINNDTKTISIISHHSTHSYRPETDDFEDREQPPTSNSIVSDVFCIRKIKLNKVFPCGRKKMCYYDSCSDFKNQSLYKSLE